MIVNAAGCGSGMKDLRLRRFPSINAALRRLGERARGADNRQRETISCSTAVAADAHLSLALVREMDFGAQAYGGSLGFRWR